MSSTSDVDDFEPVYTVPDWYDGPRGGIASFRGTPHIYRCLVDYGPIEFYWVQPIDQETFALALEEWDIWLRWDAAFRVGAVAIETHPALPEDRARYDELQAILPARLVLDPSRSIQVRAEWGDGPLTTRRVRWTPVEG